MRIFQYDEIVTPNILVALKSEVEIMNTLMDRNAWIGLYDQPDNAIEQFILDSYDFHFADKCNDVVGFEWWIHVVEKSNHMVRFHADHDEHLRVTEDEMKYPMLGTCLYLDENSNPTIFFNTQQTSKYEKQIEPFPPTDAVFSYADRGKFLVYDPTYIHGILPGSDKQITLWYNVWSYNPDNLQRVGVSRPLIERPTYKMKDIKEPVLYLGKTVSLDIDVHQRPITLKGPHGAKSMGSLWKVSQ